MTVQTLQQRPSFAGISSSGPSPSSNIFKDFNGAREVPELPASPERVAVAGTDTALKHPYLSKLNEAKSAGDTQFWNNVKDFTDISGDKSSGLRMASALHNIETGELSKVFAAAVTDTITAAEKNLTRLGVEADGMLHELNLSDENQDVIMKAAKGINTKPEAEALAAIIAKIRRKPGEGYRAELEKKITDKFGVGAMRVAENTAADIFKNAARVFYLKGSNSALDLTTEYLADLFSRPMTDLKAADVIQTALYFIKSAEEKAEVPAPAENPRAMGPATPLVSPGTVNLSESCKAPNEMNIPRINFDFSNLVKIGNVTSDSHGAPVNIGTPVINPSAKQADEAASTENQDTSNTIHVGNLTPNNRNPLNGQSNTALGTVEINDNKDKNTKQEAVLLKSEKEPERNSAFDDASGITAPSGKEEEQTNIFSSGRRAGGSHELIGGNSNLANMIKELKNKLTPVGINVGSGYEGKNSELNTTQPDGHANKIPLPPGDMKKNIMKNAFKNGSEIANDVRESLAASDITFEQLSKLAEVTGIRPDEYLPIIRKDGVKGWLNSNDLLGNSSKGRVVTTTNGLNFDLSGKRKYEDSNLNGNVRQPKMAEKLTDYKTAIYLRMQSNPGCLEGKEVPEDIISTPYYMRIIQSNNI